MEMGAGPEAGRRVRRDVRTRPRGPTTVARTTPILQPCKTEDGAEGGEGARGTGAVYARVVPLSKIMAVGAARGTGAGTVDPFDVVGMLGDSYRRM
jgi:hypothetical protein